MLSNKVWKNPAYFVAFGFGSGLIPKAPGTWGTIVAIPLYLLLAQANLWVYAVVTVLAFIFGVILCSYVSRDIGEHDYPGIVWDEIVGYLLTMFMAPAGLLWVVVGFGLFRLFDIWKPFPINVIDKHVSGGLGIMLDDLLAAILAWCILRVLSNL